jgi:hypothetical protein
MPQTTNPFNAQDLTALSNSAQCDAQIMGIIATMTSAQCQALAAQSIQRRASFVFDLLSNDALLAISAGQADMAQTCQSLLAHKH